MNRTERSLQERGHLLLEILRRELAELIKDIAVRQMQLERERLQLNARFNNSINQLYVWLDVNRKGYVDVTDLQIFLMNHKHYFEQQLLTKLLKKYSHNGVYLDVNEFYRLLLPRNRYESLSSALRYKEYELPCKTIAINLLLEDVSRLLKHELQALKNFIQKKNECLKHALRNGTTLWRLIDKQFQNMLTYEHTRKFLSEFKIEFSETHWLAFLQYCTEVGRTHLSMQEFLVVFNPEEFTRDTFSIQMKKLEYPFQTNRVELEISRDLRQADWKKRGQRIRSAEIQAADGIVEQGKLQHRQYSKKDLEKSLMTTGDFMGSRKDLIRSLAPNKPLMKSLIKQEHLPTYDLSQKKLLKYRNLGYANSTNHIKAWK